MPQEPDLMEFARVLQVVVAPVFLLMAVSGLLGVMTSRLSRVIDRSRVVKREAAADPGRAEDARREIRALALRARLVSRAITLCALAAILVCLLIALVFVGAFARIDTSAAAALIFVGAMGVLGVALLVFLREIFVATANIRIES
jgi:hypothetical protein